jgi:rhamnosyltransferase
MNRILYFVHYNKYNLISDHEIYLLKNIRGIYTRIVVISNSSLPGEQYNRLSEFCDEILLRENKGFDFGAWKDALLKDGWEKLDQYDNVTLMNDSCFGPLFDLEPIYLDMEQKDIDFWGLTNCKDDKRGMPGTNGPVPEHIQSYFICFKRKIVSSSSFKAFWKGVRYENNVAKVIQKYETRFTKILTKAGFRCSVFLDTISFPGMEFNLSFSHPDLCIKFEVPFMKIKALFVFPYPKYIIKLLQERTRYPVSIIFDYINQIYDPDTTLFIQNKFISNKKKKANGLQDTRVAVHIHSYYPDILGKFMAFLNNTNVDFDLYITTDSSGKRDVIYNYIKDQACFLKLKEIIVTQNQGRDIIPWLSIKDRLNQYDIVGHFHTKKSPGLEEWIGIVWLEDLLNSLLYNIENIISEFYNNDNLGIVIPEMPCLFRKLPLPGFSVNLNKMLNDLWNILKCRKKLDFENIKIVIFPIGSMFWYKPAALKPLFELPLLPCDIHQDLLQGETILYAIERILVYIAWNEGYDYRISLPSDIRDSNFVDFSITYDTINALTDSLAYRTGKKVLILPKAIKRCLTRIMQR